MDTTLTGKKILITGGAGFLGTNLSLALLESDNTVIIADDLSRRGSEKNLTAIKEKFPDVTVCSVGITDMPALIMKEKPDLIYHLAAQVAVTSSVESPVHDFSVNATGSFLVARAASLFDIPVIYASTNKVYGDNVNNVPLDEEETRYDFGGDFKKRGINEGFSIDASHHTPYGCSKLVGEMYVREYGGIANRFSCMYGTYQHGIVDQGWMAYFIAQKLQEKPLTIFGDGKQVRDVLHVSDVVRLFLRQGARLLDSSQPSIRGEVYTVGGGYENTLSLLELCERLSITPSFSDWRPADQKVFYCDIEKAKQTFDWVPEVSPDEGIEELIEWTKNELKQK